MFKWMKRKPKLSKIEIVNEARKSIIEFLATHEMIKLVPIFENSICDHKYLTYTMDEIHVGAFIQRFTSLAYEVDVQLANSMFKWEVRAELDFNLIIINENYVRNEKTAIELLVRGIVEKLGYLPYNGNVEVSNYLSYKLGSYISESTSV